MTICAENTILEFVSAVSQICCYCSRLSTGPCRWSHTELGVASSSNHLVKVPGVNTDTASQSGPGSW